MSIVVCLFMNNNMCIFDCVCMYSTSSCHTNTISMYQLKILTDQLIKVEVYLLT